MSTQNSAAANGEVIKQSDSISPAKTLGQSQVFTSFPPLTGLRLRPKSPTIQSAVSRSELSFAALQSGTKLLNASPIQALQVVWTAVLSAYTGVQDRISFLTAISRSNYSKCSNDAFLTIPTHMKCPDNVERYDQVSIHEALRLLTHLNGAAIDDPKWAPSPGELNARSNKYATLLVLHEGSQPCEKLDGSLERIHRLIELGEFAVCISVRSGSKNRLEFKAIYSDVVLNHPSALLVLEQFKEVLSYILSNPQGCVRIALASLNGSLMSSWNYIPKDPIEPINDTELLQTQFESYAKNEPDRVALEFKWNVSDGESATDITWTYQQLDQKADAFAKALVHRFGDQTGRVVPICMDRRPELYVAILGVLKSGAAWCPIDPAFPARRRHNLIARTEAKVLIVAEQAIANDSEGIPQSIDAIDITTISADPSASIRLPDAKKACLAYLIWTSGTTGEPKGVPISHVAVVSSMRSLQKSIPTDVTGGVVRCLQFSQYTFDVFIQDLFYTWGVGGTLISSTREVILASFAELTNKTNATHAHLTPAFAASVLRDRCKTLQVVTMIGEKLPQVVADDWSQNMRAYNTYGPAEATVVATLRRFGAPGDEIRSENVGHPLPSVSAFVMQGNQPVMKQAIGELALGGPQLSKGYWNDEKRSAERFVWNERYSRDLYMTGDMVRQLHDGSIEFVGRTDDLIKIQGIRIELSEISFSLRRCHSLVEHVEIQYLSRSDRTSKSLVAFLAAPSLEDSNTVSSGSIKSKDAILVARSALQEARANLPEYMVPRVVLVIKYIPRTSSAKTDKTRLQSIYDTVELERWESDLASDEDFDAMGFDPEERKIVTIIAVVAGISLTSVNRFSDLRSIGVDSIAGIRLASALNAEGIQAPGAKILQARTVDDLFKAIDNDIEPVRFDLVAFQKDWYSRAASQVKRPVSYVAPALPLQESLLSESMQNANSYWSHTLLSLNTSVDLERLHQAWADVVRATEALQTGFIPIAAVLNDRPKAQTTFLQLLYENNPVDWSFIQSPDSEIKHAVLEQAREVVESHRKDQFRRPLLSVTVLERPFGCIMMVSIHHAVRDEASLDLILEDVRNSYTKTSNSSKQRHQWREALQLLITTQSQIDRDEEFWTKSLADFTVTDDAATWPDLTGKSVPSENKSSGHVTHTRTLGMAYKDLQSDSLSLGASSVASILRIAWGTVLLMYLETERVVFAETWSHRSDDIVLEDVVGPLMTVLPVPFRAAGTVREALVEQSKFQRESRAHRSVHAKLIRKLINRPELQPLYPALFNFLPHVREDNQISDTSLWKKSENTVDLEVEHPMALNVYQTADGMLEMEFAAMRSVISSDHLAVLGEQVDAFVTLMLKHPDIPTSQLPSHFSRSLLSATSICFSQEVRDAWYQDPTYWVDHYAKIQPEWTAAQVVNPFSSKTYEADTWTFAELQKAYERVSASILDKDKHDQMIAICLDRRLEVYAIILGILASGNTYLPIDEDLPAERKSFLLQDSKTTMLFTTRALAQTFPNSALDEIAIYVDGDTYMDQMSNGDSLERRTQPSPNDNAYLLYTSGSTGVPKGVLVGRGNLCSFVEGLSEYIYPLISGMKDLPGKGRYLGLASRAFDVHLAEMFLPWRRGMAAVTAPRTMLLDNLELALQRLKITHASFVPSLIEQAGLDPENLPDLHYLGVGGEKMSRRVADMWARNENATLLNAYGPTEMSIGCTAAEVTAESNLRNVGRPYGNSVAHVLVPGSLDYTLRGVAGELCFTGSLVANGYHNRPEATVFVSDFHGQRMYRTGDIVRLMSDDTLEYLRRDDDQMKIRGQRLELGEISEAIRSSAASMLASDQIEVATIVALHPKLSRSQLVSFIAAKKRSRNGIKSPELLTGADDNVMTAGIKARCQEMLPAYMVPDVVIPIAKIPLAPSSGKADLKLLKAIFSDISISALMDHTMLKLSDENGPSGRELTENEEKVQSAVVSALGVNASDVRPNTNIYRCGLDSLTAISLAIRLQQLGYECTVSGVLRNPILSDLALSARKNRGGKNLADRLEETRASLSALESRFRSEATQGLCSSSVSAIRPCLPLQETLVASSMNNEKDALYVNNLILRLSTGTDPTKLFGAWTSIVARHDIFRTCFQRFENRIVQVVLHFDESRPLSWKEVTASNPQSLFEDLMSRPGAEMISDIGEKAPLRLTLLRSTSNEHDSSLLIQIHHALYDADSLQLLFEELDAEYHATSSPIHSPFTSIIEYVCSQDQTSSEEFWKRYLNVCQPSSISSSLGDVKSHQNHGNSLTIDKTITVPLTQLEAFASSTNGTLTLMTQAVFGIILARSLGTSNVVFGAILSGRTLPIEAPHTIVAPCITTIPQRVDLAIGSSDVLDIVREAQKGFAESLEYQHTALRQIHRWIEAEKPLFDCLVSYVRRKPRTKSNLWTEIEGPMPRDFPLAVEFEASYETDQLRAHCVFGPETGDKDKFDTLLEGIDLLLGALVRKEQVTLGDLGITNLDSREMARQPREWNEHDWTPTECKIRELVSDISGISATEISKGASFFTLGIDSVTAIQLAQRLRTLEMQCSSADVMRHACIGALAQHVDSAAVNSSNTTSLVKQLHPDEMVRITLLTANDSIEDIYPCTPLQSSMLTQTLGSDGRLYVHQHMVRLAKHIDLARLEEAWNRLVIAIEILRTTFHFSSETCSWFGAVHREVPEAWGEVEDCPDLSSSVAAVKETFEFSNDFDFKRPPWKITLLKAEGARMLVISMHHGLYDGESMRLLFENLATSYRTCEVTPGPPFSIAAKEISKNAADAERYWVQEVKYFRNMSVPPPSVESNALAIEVDRNITMNIEDVLQGCRGLGVTVQSVALLAYAKTLALEQGHRDVAFSHVVGGRSLRVPNADEIVGPLFNTVPFRISLEKTYDTNSKAVKDIQEHSGQSQIYQNAALNKIQQCWRKDSTRGAIDDQLSDALFVYQNYVKPSTSADELWVPYDTGKVDIPTEYSTNLEVSQHPEKLVIKVVSRKASVKREELQTLLINFEASLKDILEHPERSVLAHPIKLQNLPVNIDRSYIDNHGDSLIEPGPDLESIQSVLSEISHIPPSDISVNASIFSLGLDSIAAIQVASMCRKRNLAASVADVLQGRSLKGICQRLRAKKIKDPSESLERDSRTNGSTFRTQAIALSGVPEDRIDTVMPCLAGQAYHITNWLKSGQAMGEATFTYSSRQCMSIDSLRSAWRSLRGHHQILRTLFISISSTEVTQVVFKASALVEDAFEISECPYKSDDCILDQIKSHANTPFDLFMPPARLRLVRTEKQDYICLKLHHATYDAWSIPRLIEDLAALYCGVKLDTPPSFESFVHHTGRSLGTKAQQDYWIKSLQGGQRTLLQPSTLQDNTKSRSSISISVPSITNLQSLENSCRKSSTSLPTIILLAFARILSHYTSISNPIFGLYQTARSAPFDGIEKLCAPCLNVTPIHIPQAIRSPTTESVQRMHTDLADRVAFEQSYLRDILAWVGSQGAPLFNTFVNILAGEVESQYTELDSTANNATPLFTPYHSGLSPSDLEPKRPRGKLKTAVDGLDTSFLAERNLYLNVVKRVEADGLDFYVRCDSGLMDEMMMRSFADEVAQEMGRIVEDIRGCKVVE